MNLIKNRVKFYQGITTVSVADRGTEYLGGSFSVDSAIQKQVAYEDTVRDAKKPVVPFKVVPALPDEEKPTLLALWRFATGILP